VALVKCSSEFCRLHLERDFLFVSKATSSELPSFRRDASATGDPVHLRRVRTVLEKTVMWSIFST